MMVYILGSSVQTADITLCVTMAAGLVDSPPRSGQKMSPDEFRVLLLKKLRSWHFFPSFLDSPERHFIWLE